MTVKLLRRAVVAVTVAAILGFVFALYGRPDFVLNLSNQIWGCF
jgi:hypothetical protein